MRQMDRNAFKPSGILRVLFGPRSPGLDLALWALRQDLLHHVAFSRIAVELTSIIALRFVGAASGQPEFILHMSVKYLHQYKVF